MMRNRWLAAFLTLALGVGMSVSLAACGDDEDEGGGTGGGAAKAKKGGTITVAHTSFPDFLDPALSYTVDGWEGMSGVYIGLLTYKALPGEAGAELHPGLAEDMPDVSADGKTYSFKLRKGIKFSDGTPVKASDFRHSVERVLAQDSQGAGFFSHIVGGEDYLKTKKGHIEGITVDDDAGTIEIELTRPRGTFSNELAMTFGAVVPSSTPLDKNMTSNPPPGTGTYTIKDVKVNRSYVLERNPNFSLKGTAADAGNVDRIVAKVIRNQSNQVTQVLQNKLDFIVDPPPADRLPEVRRRAGDRFHPFSTASTYYFFMNTTQPPFDKLEVRQAVNWALDKKALARLFAGLFQPGSTVLPPGMPGHQKSDLYPGPDLVKARQMIEDAGAKGAAVTVWGNPEDPTRKVTEYYTEVLNDIGLNAKTRISPAETYFTTIGNRKTAAQTGFANWFQDYPHPANFIDTLLNPSRVTDTGNNNYSWNEADKELAKKINDLNEEPDLQAVKDRWAAIDKEIQEKAYWAIYGHRQLSTFFSERMDIENCSGEHFLYTHHWAAFCLK